MFPRRSLWFVLAFALLFAVVAPAAATTFIVNSGDDLLGTNVGNGRCETAPGNDVCTLRRAVAEADAIFAAASWPDLRRVTVVITVPVITLTQNSQLSVSAYGSLTVMGAGAAETVIEAGGNTVFSTIVGGYRRFSGFTIRHAATAITGIGELHLDYINVEDSDRALWWAGTAEVTITGCRITGSRSTALNFSTPSPPEAIVIRDTTLSGNQGTAGGAIWLLIGSLRLQGVTLADNHAVQGGAIYMAAHHTSLAITNSTFSGNSATESGGAIFTEGGSAVVPGGSGVIVQSTFVGNRADSDADGIGSGAAISTMSTTDGLHADIVLSGSIVADNIRTVPGGGGFVPAPGSCDGPLTADGPNLFSIVDCAVSNVAPTVGAAGLGPLQDNGGPTFTHLPQPGSLAIDVVPPPCLDASGAPLARDQRRLQRQAGAACGLGATEAGANAIPRGTRHDFDGDGRGDLVWRNDRTGAVATWLMNGSTASGSFLRSVDSSWQIAAIGDFDGDGISDLLWRRPADGLNAIWFMAPPDGTPSSVPTVRAGVYLPSLEDSGPYVWRARAGDFDGDGRDDLLWELKAATNATGLAALWLMDGAAVKAARALPAAASDRGVVGVGDVNGDGTADIVWHSGVDWSNEVWLMAGGARQSILALPTSANAFWTAVGLADISGDGTADLVWRWVDGQYEVWLMDGGIVTRVSLPTVAYENWNVSAVVDTDGDGRADLIWRSPRNGQNARCQMQGGTVTAGTYLPTVTDQDWHIIP